MVYALTVTTLALTASCKNDDNTPGVEASSITVAPLELYLEIGNTHTLTATVLPAEAAAEPVTWESFDKSIVTVNPTEGTSTTVTAVSAGTTTVSAVTSNNLRAICEITVSKTVQLEAITISPNAPIYIETGDTLYLTATQSPANATNYSPQWTSGNTAIASVLQPGEVVGVSAGTTTITVTSGSISTSVEITVTSTLTGIIVTPAEPTLDEIGTTLQLTATPEPSTATLNNPVWRSLNENIVTVSSTGELTAIGTGTATITVASGDIEVSVDVRVNSAYLSDIEVPATAGIRTGESLTIEATPIPATAKNYEPVWSSSDESTVTVTQDGTITGIQTGTAIITLTSGIITKTITVTVDMIKYLTEGWTAESRNGNHNWNDLGACAPSPDECGGATAGGQAHLVLDGNPWTGWHSMPGTPLPQCLVIDMKESKEVDRIVIRHRPDAFDSSHGNWVYYRTIQVYLSDEPVTPDEYQTSWGAAAAVYQYPGGNLDPVTIELEAGSAGQYLILYFEDSAEATYISFSELEVYKKI
jgi:uncharacterized protein YjdB